MTHELRTSLLILRFLESFKLTLYFLSSILSCHKLAGDRLLIDKKINYGIFLTLNWFSIAKDKFIAAFNHHRQWKRDFSRLVGINTHKNCIFAQISFERLSYRAKETHTSLVNVIYPRLQNGANLLGSVSGFPSQSCDRPNLMGQTSWSYTKKFWESVV